MMSKSLTTVWIIFLVSLAGWNLLNSLLIFNRNGDDDARERRVLHLEWQQGQIDSKLTILANDQLKIMNYLRDLHDKLIPTKEGALTEPLDTFHPTPFSGESDPN